MIYRDHLEQCPRCHVELVDAGSARRCSNCGGLWLQEDVVTEMVLEMVPPGMFGRLVVQPRPEPRTDDLGCPECKRPMQRIAMHGIPIDRCTAHGIWFDPDELEQVLRRCAKEGTRSLDGRLPRRQPAPAPAPAPEPPAAATPPPAVSADALRFRIRGPDGSIRDEHLDQPIIKIGRAANAHVRIDDPAAARLHAVIDASEPGDVVLIDLGSDAGTTVNGVRSIKQSLTTGDVIGVGATQIEVTIPR